MILRVLHTFLKAKITKEEKTKYVISSVFVTFWTKVKIFNPSTSFRIITFRKLSKSYCKAICSADPYTRHREARM